MQVVQALVGVFHHFDLAQELHRRGHLRRIYSTFPWTRLKREGLPRSLVSTFPWITTPNLLLRRSLPMPRGFPEAVDAWNLKMFDAYTHALIPPCDAFIAISGVGLRTGLLVQQRGGVFICDRGSTHHRFQQETVAREYSLWGASAHLHGRIFTEREEAIYEAADAITVPSQVVRRSFVQMGVPAEKVHVIPYGVRLERFRRTAEPPTDTFEVLFAGQVSLRKGIPYLLQAFARLRHAGKRLTVVGAILPHMVAILRTLPTEQVTFTGTLPTAELAERMSRSHVLLLPSVEEGLALVQAQAMACGCPVIATQATGAEDLFTDGVEGYIVSDRDVDSLADRLQRIADDPVLQKQFAEAALRRVHLAGGWDEYGRRWDDLLHNLTGLLRDPA